MVENIAVDNLIYLSQGVFWIYGGVCVLLFIWGLFFLPETKGKTLEQIQACWL